MKKRKSSEKTIRNPLSSHQFGSKLETTLSKPFVLREKESWVDPVPVVAICFSQRTKLKTKSH